MYSQYKIIDVLAKKTGGHYALSTLLIKRAKQLLMDKAHMLGQKRTDPLQEALDEFTRGELTISEGEDVALEEKEGGKLP
jgi:DNA-directed RNA polymerase subunit K/omega